MNDYKIPSYELSGESNLNGTYRVSFTIDIADDDNMSIDDLRHAIASGVANDPVLYKISKLGLEKTDKEGNVLVLTPNYKVGDLITITKDTQISAKIESYRGYYIVGAQISDADTINEGVVFIPEGTQARVNSIQGNNVELVDFDSAVCTHLQDKETGEVCEIFASVDHVICPSINVASLTEENDLCR